MGASDAGDIVRESESRLPKTPTIRQDPVLGFGMREFMGLIQSQLILVREDQMQVE